MTEGETREFRQRAKTTEDTKDETHKRGQGVTELTDPAENVLEQRRNRGRRRKGTHTERQRHELGAESRPSRVRKETTHASERLTRGDPTNVEKHEDGNQTAGRKEDE